MFQPVSSKVNFPQMEERILQFWRQHDVFRKSVEQRPHDRLFVFYEGPPTANASPGIHSALPRIFKDVIIRYRAMRGYCVPRRAGWDTHGLPVELEVEKELGLKSKQEIEQFGVEEFNRRCRESVMRYVKDYETFTERLAFWVDMEDAYITYDNGYIETGWWIIKQLWERGLIYQEYRVTPHCPRCGTSLSDHEVAQGYREDTPDPSIYVKFRLTPESARQLGLGGDMPTYFLAWTTTPWTLPGNTALAVSPYAEYALVERRAEDGSERLILANDLVNRAPLGESHVVERFLGQRLGGLTYQPLYQPQEWGVEALRFEDGRLTRLKPADADKAHHRVIAADFVSLTEGTGIVHIAPAFGQEDFEAGKAEGLLFLQPVDARGRFPESSPFPGLFVKDADELVMQDLQERGLLLARGVLRHTYPFCWRCDTPLLYYAKPTWYIRTTAVRERLLSGNQEIRWYPEHIRDGRFGDWLQNNVDWAISRERYWGTPLPIWRCGLCGELVCIGSVAELKQRARDRQKVEALSDLHRPYIDEVTFSCDNCGGTMRRVPEVIDCWFDSGAMPYAQWHYPFANQEAFQRNFPADFICEAVDQTRGWFYTLHALATLLMGGPCFRNVICHGHVLDEQGRKMSKSLGNVVDPWLVFNTYGVDATRWYLYTVSPLGNPRRFSPHLVGESLRKFLLTLWNTYSFFITYAIIDRFDPRSAPAAQPSGEPVEPRPELDRWALSELNLLVERVTGHLESYNPTDAGRAIAAFVDDLSNWYVRRSRRRFWKSEDDADKRSAHQTLYTCLLTLAKLLAPFTPFVAEEMYQNLVRSWDQAAPESVHLCDWPQADMTLVDEALSQDVRLAMRIASLGRAARSKAGIKVRQPLLAVLVRVRTAAERDALTRVAAQVAEEVNVKGVIAADPETGRLSLVTQAALILPLPVIAADNGAEGLSLQEVLASQEQSGRYVVVEEGGYLVALDTQLTPELRDEGLARELVHRLQTMRKSAGFDIADRIVTYYQGGEAVQRVMVRFGDYVRGETLSQELVAGPPPHGAHVEEHRVDGQPVTLAVVRLAR